MIAIPKKRERQRSGIERAPRREFPTHRRHVARHECVVTLSPNPTPCRGQIRACHYRTAATAGSGLKSFDWLIFPGCDGHHEEEHRGTKTFQENHGISLPKICREFAEKSPDRMMRIVYREALASGAFSWESLE